MNCVTKATTQFISYAHDPHSVVAWQPTTLGQGKQVGIDRDHMGKGMTLSKAELLALKELLNSIEL